MNKSDNSHRSDYNNHPTGTAAAMVITILEDQLDLTGSPPLMAAESSVAYVLLPIFALFELLAELFALLAAAMVPPAAVGLEAIMLSVSGKESDRDMAGPTSTAVAGIDSERELRGIDMAVSSSIAMVGIDKESDMEVPTSIAVVGIDKDRESELVTSIISLWSERFWSAWIDDDSRLKDERLSLSF